MRRPARIIIFTLIAGLAVLAAVQVRSRSELPPQDLVITTATKGGTYIRLGEILARVLEEYPGGKIGRVLAVDSAGSVENIDRLTNPQADSKADLAFVVGPTLAEDPRFNEVRTLMVLYSDIVQVVVRKSASVLSLDDLRGKRIYIGGDGSGTKWIASRILNSAGLSESDYLRVKANSYGEASGKLMTDEADAAIFMASAPVDAVSAALDSECCALLDLGNDADSIKAAVPGMETVHIPAHLYKNQQSAVGTLGARSLLVGRKDLRDEVVVEILNALFDNLSKFVVAHIHVDDIRLERAFELPEGIAKEGVLLHPGVNAFQKQENERLLIATGTINGKYYQIGKRMQVVLKQKGIPSRVIHTDGSLENLELLKNCSRPVVAIMQYDAALASYWSPSIYGTTESLDIPRVRGLRRIAALHEEKVHVLVRRARIKGKAGERPTVNVLKDMQVCLGPEKSATRIIARVILQHHGISPKEVPLSIPDMVARIHSGDIDAGFFVSYIPSKALKTVINDDRNVLLSIDSRKIAGMLGPALGVSSIESNTYRAQHKGEPPVSTIATWAVLVTKDDLPQARRITEAVFEGAAFLGIKGGGNTMARKLDSLPLHPEAETYYQEADYLPTPLTTKDRIFEWLHATWRFMAILVIVVAGYSGFIKLKRNRTSNRIGRRILGISVDANEPKSVMKLFLIQEEIRERVRQRWWQLGEIDKPRWRYLQDLINDSIMEAKENLTRSLVVEIRRNLDDDSLDDEARMERQTALKRRVGTVFEKGEIAESQYWLLIKLIGDA
jgi:TRAP transporter TAXI family solute receptor